MKVNHKHTRSHRGAETGGWTGVTDEQASSSPIRGAHTCLVPHGEARSFSAGVSISRHGEARPEGPAWRGHARLSAWVS